MFKKPLRQTVWTQIKLLLYEQIDLGTPCLLLYLNSSVMLGNYLQQTTSADFIFQMLFFLARKDKTLVTFDVIGALMVNLLENAF